MTADASPKVSACLLSWRRPRNLGPIVDYLHGYDFIDEILVWNNAADVTLDISGPKVRVLHSDENLGCAGRYLCAAEARNQLVYTQDDDVIVHNVPALLDAFRDAPTRIAHNLSAWHYDRRDDYHHGACHVAFLGWGAVFDARWVGELDRLPTSVRRSALYRREADKYFTVLQHRRHTTLRGELEPLEGDSDPAVALWKQPDHRELSARAIRHALALARQRHRPWLPARWNVVIPCRNDGRYLHEAVQSVVMNEADADVTIVDDGSDDGSLGVARELVERYERVDVAALPRSLGPAAATNRGIAASDSAFVVKLDADDRIGPVYLRAADTVLSAGADVANPDAILFGDEHTRWSVPDSVNLASLLERNTVHGAAAFRRSLWAQVGGLDEDLARWEDYDFWIRLAACGARIRKVAGDHFHYRRHFGSRSRQAFDPAQARARLRAKHAELYRAHGLEVT